MATTYFVDDAVGDDANAGTSEGAGNAFKTINKAATVVIAGDFVRIKGTGIYKETVTIVTVGTDTAPIEWEGYTSTVGDGGIITIDGESTRAEGMATSLATALKQVFKNIKITATTADGWAFSSESECSFKNCEGSNCGADGFDLNEKASLENCTAANNSDDGIEVGNRSSIVGCDCDTNAMGIEGASCHISFCRFFDNETTSIFMSGSLYAINNTIDMVDKTGIGIDISGPSVICVVNNIITRCGTGIQSSEDNVELIVSRNNLLFDNTTDYSSFNTFTGEVTTDPTFVNQATGDLRLASGSPAKGAGYDVGTLINTASFADIGAHQMDAAVAVNGGISFVHPGMAGGINA